MTTKSGKYMGQGECLSNPVGHVNLYSYYGNQYGSFSKRLKTELSFDPAAPLLDIYPNDSK